MSAPNNNLDKLLTQTKSIKMVIAGILALILIGSAFYIRSKVNYIDNKCSDLKEIYTDIGTVSSINPDDSRFDKYKLRDYYIKTAYNCCALGDFKNTFVSLCALKEVIRQGVRGLDFEVYSINNDPVVAVSSLSEYNIKESYNSLSFAKVMETIRDYAFSGSTCPNPNDPLIIHLRIKSNNDAIFDKMTQAFYDTLEDHVLGPDYSYENNGDNLGAEPIKNLMGKAILIVDKSNSAFEKTSLDEYVNMCSNSVFMRALRDYNVKYTPDFKELVEFNKKNMTISMPDLSSSDKNVSPAVHLKYGVQMIGMCYQNYDEHLEFYETFFGGAGHSFVLKPEPLRYKPVTMKRPPPQNPKLSYASRPVKSDFYSFDI